jgi:hypothetical protein
MLPPPAPTSFPTPSLFSSRLGDHVIPGLNHVDEDCIPLPASVCLLS